MPGIGPGREPGDDIELAKDLPDDLVGIACGAEVIELRHHFRERLFHIADGALRVELPLLLETALTANEFLTVEIRDGMQNGLAGGPRIDQQVRQTVP